MQVRMGSISNSNDGCAALGLPLSETTHIVFSLLGDTFSVWCDGELQCLRDFARQRVAGKSNVNLDDFSSWRLLVLCCVHRHSACGQVVYDAFATRAGCSPGGVRPYPEGTARDVQVFWLPVFVALCCALLLCRFFVVAFYVFGEFYESSGFVKSVPIAISASPRNTAAETKDRIGDLQSMDKALDS